jgi:quinol monooxygenase YgiN
MLLQIFETKSAIMTKPLVFYVEFDVKPEFIDKFIAEATKVLEAMSVEDTFIDTYFHRNVNEPNKFTLYERWSEPSMDDFVKNQLEAKVYRAEYEKILPEMLASERTFAVLDPIGEWQK